MSTQKCQAANCNRKCRDNVKFFSFPSDNERKKLWMKFCEADICINPSRNRKLCEMHFSDDQFENRRVDGVRKLKWNAVPTIKSSILTRSETATIKVEDPTYGIKTEPLYQGYEELLITSMTPDRPENIEQTSETICRICGSSFEANPYNLCKVCGKFELEKKFNIDKKKNRMVIKYQCAECLKAFSNFNTYQRHVKCHDEKKPYRCTHCMQRFYHSKDLFDHMEKHEESSIISLTPTTSQSSLRVVDTRTFLNHDNGFSINSASKKDSFVRTGDLNSASIIDNNSQLIKLESSVDMMNVEKEVSTKMFKNPYDSSLVQFENYELFADYQEGENETVENDVFYDCSISSSSTALTTDTEINESIIKIEPDILQSTAELAKDEIEYPTDDLEAIAEEYEINEIKEEFDEQVVDQNQTQRECYICKHCHKDFMYFGNYAKHLEQHSIGKLMCKFCSQIFGSTYQIRKHIKDYHSNQEMFDCNVCFIRYPKHYFASHMRTHQIGDKPLICKYCGCRFSEPSDLFYHFKNYHSDSTESNVSVNNSSNLESSSNQDNKIVPETGYKCKYCGIVFDDVIKMYHHVKIHIKQTSASKRRLL